MWLSSKTLDAAQERGRQQMRGPVDCHDPRALFVPLRSGTGTIEGGRKKEAIYLRGIR